MSSGCKGTRVILQAALVAFLLNATLAYGDCCLSFDQSQAEASAPPCHHAETNKPVQIDGDCCLSCAPMMGASTEVTSHVITSRTASPEIEVLLASGGMDPPYRPPIAHLS